MNLRDFINGYIECAEWSEQITLTEDQKKGIESDCAKFLEQTETLLDETDYRSSQAGHDFFLTRNRHGAGFWEGDHCTKEQGQKLTQISHTFGETYYGE